jgi:hypothetical protein
MDENNFVRQIFLNQFIKGMMINSKYSATKNITPGMNVQQILEKKSVPAEKLKPKFRPIMPPQFRMPSRRTLPPPVQPFPVQQKKKIDFEEGTGKFTGFQKSMRSGESTPEAPINKKTENNPMNVPTPMKTTGHSIFLGEELGKVISFLNDPSVFAVECKGEGQNLLVNRQGNILVTQLSLSKEEIDNLLDEISRKTRIPVMSGVFKAVFDDYIITAVISEFVGKRFVIQKRPAMQQVPMYRG